MKQKVVVVGHGYTSRLSIIRSVGIAGYDVDVVIIYPKRKIPKNKPIDCYSKYVNKIHYVPTGDKRFLIDLLIKNYKICKNKPLLIPDSDYSVAAIDLSYNELSKYFLIPNIDNQRGAVVHWMNKAIQKERAKSVGLNVALAVIISIKNGEFHIPSTIKYPCFPKSVDGGKTGLGRCDNCEMLSKSLSQMAAVRDRDVLIEEYLEIDKEYALVGFSDGKNVCIPAVLYNENMSKGSHYGVAKGGRVSPVDAYAPLIEKFKKLISSIHFVGIFDIDFLECNGTFYFDEINLRFGGSGHAVTMAGVNLPAMFAEFMTKKTYRMQTVSSDVNLSFVNERICIDEWYEGYVTRKELSVYIKNADISFIKDDSDPHPYISFIKYYKGLRIKRSVRLILKKLHLK